jgi:hypothetical protein
MLRGMLLIHDGDESGFTAEGSEPPELRAKPQPSHRGRR